MMVAETAERDGPPELFLSLRKVAELHGLSTIKS